MEIYHWYGQVVHHILWSTLTCWMRFCALWQVAERLKGHLYLSDRTHTHKIEHAIAYEEPIICSLGKWSQPEPIIYSLPSHYRLLRVLCDLLSFLTLFVLSHAQSTCFFLHSHSFLPPPFSLSLRLFVWWGSLLQWPGLLGWWVYKHTAFHCSNSEYIFKPISC